MKPVSSIGYTNSKIAEAVAIIGQIGPNVPEVARRMREHKETVRYWYKKLTYKGFLVQASIDYEKLGLKRVVVVADFSKEFESHAEPILATMNRLSYVENFVLTTPESHYIISSAVPEEFVKQWIGSIKRLKDGGLFSSLEFSVFEQARNVPIRSEHYDFDSGTWDFEWSASPKVYPEIIKQPSFKAKFDKTDLEIIKRLQLDASKSLVEIQKETGANYKTLGFHHRTHVIGRDLFEGYKVDWIGARYNRMEKRAEHRRHRYQLVDVMVRDISESRRLELMGMTNALPFLCWEAWGEGYYAKMAFPMESLVEAMQFLTRLFSNVKDKASWFLIDQSHSVTFTIVPELYDESTKRWKFNQEEMLRKFERLMLQIKEGGSRVPEAPSSRNHPSVDRG